MATIRLIPSTYALSNSSYFSVSNANNAYANTDSTNYATFQTTNNSTSSRYIYLRGFNFNDIPSGAVISSFTVKIKGYESGANTGTSYAPRLANGTSALSNTTASQNFSTSSRTITIPTGALTWTDIVNYGSNFTIQVNARRNSRNTASYVYIYGAEIEVTYTTPTQRTITSTLTGNGTINPSGAETHYDGDTYTITITPSDTSEEVTITNNNVDVTTQLEAHSNSTSDSIDQTASSFTTELSSNNANFYTSSSTTGNYFNYAVGHTAASPGSTSTSYNTYVKDGNNNTATGWAWYTFSFSSIPNNAIIDDITVQCYGACESTTHDSTHKANITLYTGNTLKSTEQYFTSTSNQTITISNPGTWTRTELQSAKLKFEVAYYGGRLFGITWTVAYHTPGSGIAYYTYSYTVSGNALIAVTIGSSGPYIPDPEDPQKTYYSLTISSINATTSINGDNVSGTIRVEEGSDETITITPSDPQLTLALDNGIDITSQLVGSVPSNTYTVTTQKSGASYGFPLNNNTGYYTSNNNGVSNSAAVCTVNFNFETSCLVTISYINYAEATYDYGIFSQIDGSLGTTYSADSGAYHTCSANADNTANVQTLTYTIPAGNHSIDIKYRKDQYTDSNNDNLQWKITSIESTQGAGYYTYTLEDIDRKHSLIFIFGDVTYYFITSMVGGDGRIFPDGQQVVLPGDSYRLNIVPDNYQATVTLLDNNVNVTAQLDSETGQDKQGNTITSYKYTLSNIQAAHNLVVSIGGASIKLYVKINGSWVQYSKAYVKINGSWVEQDITGVFSSNTNYVKGN